MCGRFTLHGSPNSVAEQFHLEPREASGLEPRYNIAPTQPVAAVALSTTGEGRSLAHLRWGLVPRWVKDPKDLPTLINARSESAAEKPAFRDAFRNRRCLVVADGFYEWTAGPGGSRQPHYVRRGDRSLFGFAGLWERWEGEDGGRIDSCTILTTDASDLPRPLHDRMPVILHREHHASWLDPAAGRRQLEALLRPFPNEELAVYPVDSRMNSPKVDDPACIEPVEVG